MGTESLQPLEFPNRELDREFIGEERCDKDAK
jgi:hypothetical protein